MRSGGDFVGSLRDGREVYVEGELIEDITCSPTFSGIIETIAGLYDATASSPHHPPGGSGGVRPQYTVPASAADLAARSRASREWAQLTDGWLLRAPDHVGGLLTGLAGRAEVFDRPEFQLAENVRRWHGRLVSEDLYLSYATVPPPATATRRRSSTRAPAQVHVESQSDDGILVSGAQVPGAGVAVSDILFVTAVNPLSSEDRDLAVSFVTPTATPGLRIECRRGYGEDGSGYGGQMLASRYDEVDGLIVFEHVLVPWENVFLCRDLGGLRGQFIETPGFLYSKEQALVRSSVKLCFLERLGRAVCAASGSARLPRMRELLGELSAMSSAMSALSLAADAGGTVDDHGVAWPDIRSVTAGIALYSEWLPRSMEILREVAGGAVLHVPSPPSLATGPVRQDFSRYCVPDGERCLDHLQLLSLVREVIGSGFGARHQQFDLLAGGSPFAKWQDAYLSSAAEPAADTFRHLMSAEAADWRTDE